jgi:hypothetical protein
MSALSILGEGSGNTAMAHLAFPDEHANWIKPKPSLPARQARICNEIYPPENQRTVHLNGRDTIALTTHASPALTKPRPTPMLKSNPFISTSAATKREWLRSRAGTNDASGP